MGRPSRRIEPDFDYECSGVWNDLVIFVEPTRKGLHTKEVKRYIGYILKQVPIDQFIDAEWLSPHTVRMIYSCKDAKFREVKIVQGCKGEQVRVSRWNYVTCVCVRIVGRDACVELFDEEEAYEEAIAYLRDNMPQRRFTFIRSERIDNLEVVFEFNSRA